MKKILTLILISVLVACSSNEPRRVRTSSGEKIQIEDSKYGFKLHTFEQVELPNGLNLILLPDNELPYLTLSLMVRSGSTSDPKGQEGLTNLMGELLDRGTTTRKALEFADQVAHIGASVDVSVALDYMSATTSGLSNHGNELLQLFSEMILQPAFSGDELERLKKQTIANIDRQVDEPGSFASLAWDRYLYKGHLYSRPIAGTKKSLRSLSRRQVLKQYFKVMRPNNAYLAVVGRWSPEFLQNLKSRLGTWSKGEVPMLDRGQADAITKPLVQVVDKPGQVQSQVYLGHMGVARNHPDYIRLRVANTILGGAFNSRLVNHVRKDKGLTYSIRSGFDNGIDTGSFEISTFTKNATTANIVSETLVALKKFVDEGPTDAEVQMAKAYLKGTFPQAIETPEKLAFNLLFLRVYGIPDSYLSNYLRDVDKVTIEDVRRVAKEFISPDKVKILIYGSSSDVVPSLKTLGYPVERVSAQQLL